MTDRELLEMAAKAAGMHDAEYQDGGDWMEVRYGFTEAIWSETHGNYWNPLLLDGDALRLAVKLNLTLRLYSGNACAQSTTPGGPSVYVDETNHDQPTAATRRAIVRAAAEIAHALNGSPARQGAEPDGQDLNPALSASASPATKEQQ